MASETKIIRINWDGPHTLKEVEKLDTAKDRGIYQIYGLHPIYCRMDLLYIGKAQERPFAVRIPEHGRWIHYTRDDSQVLIYVGRLCGPETPDNALWEEQIALAEQLLIYAHYPTYNTQKNGFEAGLRRDHQATSNLHILNMGRFRDLLPEVSGLRYSDVSNFQPYGSNPSRGMTPETTITDKRIGL